MFTREVPWTFCCKIVEIPQKFQESNSRITKIRRLLSPVNEGKTSASHTLYNRAFMKKSKISKKNPTMNGLGMHHLHPFKKKPGEGHHHPPPHAKGTKTPASRITESSLKANIGPVS